MRIKMRVPDLEPEIRMQIEDERNAICTPVVVNKPIHYEIYHNEKEIHCDWEGLVAIATSPTAVVVQHEDYIEFIVTDKNGTTRAVLYGAGSNIRYDTKANWDAQSDLISQQGNIYVYTDYTTDMLNNQPGVKIGDGQTLLIDLPFMNDISSLPHNYTAGNGLVLNDYEFSLDDLILECGTSTTIIQG